MYIILIIAVIIFLAFKGKNTSSSTSPNNNHPYQNNNPLNVKGTGWNGQIGSDSQGHATFDTIDNGIRAAIKNLHTYYYIHKLNTILGICQRWAVANQKNYANFIALGTGIGSTQIFDWNEKNITKIVYYMAKFETKPEYLPANLMDIIIRQFNFLYPNQITSSTIIIPYTPKVIASDVIKSIPDVEIVTNTPVINNFTAINQTGAASSQASCINSTGLGLTFIKPLL